MTYEIRIPQEIDNKKIKLGKTFKYSLCENYNLTNIYYVNDVSDANISNSVEKIEKKQDSTDDKTKLIIQTPLMYIPNSIIYFNEKPFLELSFNNEENDKDVSEFKNWIIDIEEYIFKLIKKRSSLGVKKENMISILKQKNTNYANSSTKVLVPINMNISKCILTNDCKKSKFLFNWEIPVPTYGISIIWVKNIWIKNGKWGINLFMYASRVMNSHILDPINFLGIDNDNKSIKIFEVSNKFKNDEKMSIQVGQIPDYIMFFKMLKLGIPKDAIKQKIVLSGLDMRIIDYPETTPYATVLHYISNPRLGPYVKAENATQNTSQNTSQNTTINAPNNTSTHCSTPNSNLNPNPILKLDMLKNINSGGFSLKKVNIDENEKLKQKNKDNILNKINSNGLKVPTLCDIQGALSKLRKVEIDTSC